MNGKKAVGLGRSKMHALVALVTVAAVLFYFFTSFGVATARRVSGINAPDMLGHPQLERAVRVHMNTLEWMPIFLVLLWLFAVFVPSPYGDYGASVLGLVWIVGRYIYRTGYMSDPANRSTGFLIQALACIALLIGAVGGAGWTLVKGG
jgi:glutathione S-transferase